VCEYGNYHDLAAAGERNDDVALTPQRGTGGPIETAMAYYSSPMPASGACGPLPGSRYGVRLKYTSTTRHGWA
jgi:hypothetical protein